MRTACCVGLVVAGLIGAAVLGAGGRLHAEDARAEVVKPERAAAAAHAAPWPGATVTVYLRGDATGTSYADRLPSTGNLLARSGTVVAVDGGWLALRDGNRIFRYPVSSIAAVESEAKDAR